MKPIQALVEQDAMIRKLKGLPPRKFRKPKRQLVPKGIERNYRSMLLDIVDSTKEAVDKFLVPNLKALERSLGLREDVRQDIGDFDDLLNGFLGNLALEASRFLTDDKANSIAGTASKLVNTFNRRQVFEQMKGVLSVDVFTAEPRLNQLSKNFVNENVRLIKTIPERYLSEVEGIVRREFAQGNTAETITERILDVFGKSRSNAARIARDQVNKLNGQLTRMRQTELGIESYIWRTSLDDRVRSSHRDKEGQEFRWDSPPSDTGHPGQDINCRCTAEPVFTDLIP